MWYGGAGPSTRAEAPMRHWRPAVTMAGMTHSGPPLVDPRQLRPRRAWYAVAGVIALVGVLAGVALLVLAVQGFRSLSSAFPEPIAEFGGTEAATVQLTAAKHWAVFMAGPSVPPVSRTPSTPTASAPTVSARCTGRGIDGGTVDLTKPSYRYTSSAADGGTWYLVYEVKVSQDGRYEFSCTPDDSQAGSDRYAVGESPDVEGFVATMLGGFVGTFGTVACPCVGILVATVIVVVTAVRRNAQQRRLRFLPGGGYGMRTGPPGRRAWGPGSGPGGSSGEDRP